jgi:hypothetical protein
MTIKTLFETDLYRYDHDTLMGVGWYVRKADDTVSLMVTGSDADELNWHYTRLATRRAIHNLSAAQFDSVFNEVAAKQEYSSRWDETRKEP